ncbi:MAG: NADH-quinone oxidoreductase subunit N, partial [Coxiellaceae bacterium]|nr:NADH-quinone oxidoreductase subunit N [Coxiellaceae bacterium]
FNTPKTYAFHAMYLHSHLTSVLKLFIYLISFFAFLYSQRYISEREIHQGEYYILGLFSILGMIILVSANSLLVLFLSLELMALPIYAMIAMQRNSGRSSEAAIKYFVTGGMASGLLLYGISMLYGMTNSLDINTVAASVMLTPIHQQLLLIFALVFMVAGIFFKLGAAPFHMWAPDVYEGAPTSVTLFLSSAPKVAAFALAIRLLVDAMPSSSVEWQQVIIVIALISMAWGNIVAIVQSNLKRMLAYSSIAHMGYMSLGLIAASNAGYAAAMFYMLVYAIMSLGAFAILTILSKKGVEVENIIDLKGLNSRNPWMALMMLLLMFSMAGIPPTAGFFAKLGVLEALVNAHFIPLAAIALVFAVIGAY